MSQGKNKKLSKGRKGGKKKVVDPFARKEWYDIKVPTVFTKRIMGKTFVNKSAGIKLAKDALKGRVFESFLADLHTDNNTDTFRKIRLRCENVQGATVLTQFHGMSITSDKLRSLIKKWQSIIEANVEVKTTDNFQLRFFMIGFTKKTNYTQRTAYAQTQQIRQIRKKMVDAMRRKFSECDIKQVVEQLQSDALPSQIIKECSSIYPIKDVIIRKVKVVKAPKMDVAKLLEAYTEAGNAEADAAPTESTGAPTTEAETVKA